MDSAESRSLLKDRLCERGLESSVGGDDSEENFAAAISILASVGGGWLGEQRNGEGRGIAGDAKRREADPMVGGNSLQSTRSAFNNALPCTLGDLEREPITGEWNRMVFVVSVLSSP